MLLVIQISLWLLTIARLLGYVVGCHIIAQLVAHSVYLYCVCCCINRVRMQSVASSVIVSASAPPFSG